MHVIDGLGLGGAERVLVDLANATVRDGHRVTVCVTRSEVSRAAELDDRVHLLVLHRKRAIAPRAIAKLVRWIREHRVELVHAHMRSTAAHMLMLRALKLVPVPVIVHDHYGSIETDKHVPLWFRVGHRFADYYVGVSDQLLEWARSAGVPPERSIAIGNAIDFARIADATVSPIREQLGIARETCLGIAVSTIRRDKGIDILLEAIAGLPHRDRLHVLFVGADGDPAYAAACRRLSSELGLQDTVRFLGGRGDIPELLRAADVGILASRSESGPLVLAEYAVSGLPIVGTLVGDIGRRLAALGVEELVTPGDAHELAAALERVVALAPTDRRARGQRGSDLVGAAWDIRHVMGRWYELYDRVFRSK